MTVLPTVMGVTPLGSCNRRAKRWQQRNSNVVAQENDGSIIQARTIGASINESLALVMGTLPLGSCWQSYKADSSKSTPIAL